MLIDGNALIHRGFHAIPALTNKAGEHTNATYGFTMILLRAIKDLKPTHIACSFDLAGPTFRHEQYADYKATRAKGAQELYDQFPPRKRSCAWGNWSYNSCAPFARCSFIVGILLMAKCRSG